MPTNSIVVTTQQVASIELVDSVVVSAIVDDGTNTGTWVRSIKIFGQPNSTNGPPILEIDIRSTVQANLDITTPELTF